MNLQDVLVISLSFIVGICYGVIFVVYWIKKYGFLTWDRKKNIILIFKKIEEEK